MADPIDISGDQMIDTSMDQFLPADAKPDYVQRSENQQPINPQDPAFARQQQQWITQAQAPTDFGTLSNAAAQKASMGLLPLAMDVGKYAVDQFGKGNALFGPLSGGEKVGTQYRQEYQKSAQKVPLAAMAGGMMNPANYLGGSGVIGNMAVGAGTAGVQNVASSGSVQQGPVDPLSQGLMSAAPAAIMKAGGSVLDWASKTMAPKALELVKSMADQIIRSKAPLDTSQYVRSPSKMGFKDAYQDILYTVINKLRPQAFQSGLAKQQRLGQAARQAGQQVQGALSRATQTRVPAQQLQSDLQSLARNQQLGTGQRGGTGSDVASIIRNQFNVTPSKVAQASRPTSFQMGPTQQMLPQQSVGGAKKLPVFDQQAQQVSKIIDPRTGKPTTIPRKLVSSGQDMFSFQPQLKQAPVQQSFQVQPQLQDPSIQLSQLNQRRMEITSPQFKPAYQVSQPDVAPVRAGQQIRDYMTTKAGYTPEQMARLKQANLGNQMVSKTQQIFGNNQSKGAGGLTQNTPRGAAYGFLGHQARQKAPSLVYAASKQAAQRAMARLERRYGTGQFTSSSPFQIEQVKAKLATISQMDPKQASAFVYAESMMNPLFRQVWNERDND